MRASSRRSHHSSAGPPPGCVAPVKLPRIAEPCCSSAASAGSTSSARKPNGAASASAVTGPSASSRLRTSSRSAASASRGGGVERRPSSARPRPRCGNASAELGEPLGADPDRARARQSRRPSRGRPRASARTPRPNRGRLRRPRRSRAARARRAARPALLRMRPRFVAHALDRFGVELPSSAACSGVMKRRVCTASVRRSSAGASSRNAYGFAPSISCASGDGLVSSRHSTSTSPVSIRFSSARQPSTSIAPVRQSASVCSTSGWSGISRSPPGRFSAHAS